MAAGLVLLALPAEAGVPRPPGLIPHVAVPLPRAAPPRVGAALSEAQAPAAPQTMGMAGQTAAPALRPTRQMPPVQALE
jgi:hypothetical protein